jgi:hypothetical protein
MKPLGYVEQTALDILAEEGFAEIEVATRRCAPPCPCIAIFTLEQVMAVAINAYKEGGLSL